MSERDEDATDPALPRPRAVTNPPGRTFKVFVADPSQDRQEFLARWLERHGSRVLRATEGRVILRMLELSGRRRLPDLLLCHQDLSDVPGSQLVAVIRSDPEFCDLEILLYAGDFARTFPELARMISEKLREVTARSEDDPDVRRGRRAGTALPPTR